MLFCMIPSQRVMHQTFKDAFAEVENEVLEKLFVSYGLLTELHSRRVITQRQVATIKVRILPFGALIKALILSCTSQIMFYVVNHYRSKLFLISIFLLLL